jgi:hypothetical protein
MMQSNNLSKINHNFIVKHDTISLVPRVMESRHGDG